MIPVPIILGGVLVIGAAWWFLGDNPREAHDSGGDAATETTVGGVTLAKGLHTAHSGIKLNARLIAFAMKLRAQCSAEIVPDLVITSGIRDEYGQARAMLAYVTRYGATPASRTAEGTREKTDLTTLYGGTAASELLALPARDVGSWAPVVRDLYRRKILNPGGHYGGGAMDVREGTPAQRDEIIRAARAAGARKAYDDGPAVHIDVPEAV